MRSLQKPNKTLSIALSSSLTTSFVRRLSSQKENRRLTRKKRKLLKTAAEAFITTPITFTKLLQAYAATINLDCESAIEEVKLFHNNLIKNHQVVEGTARFNSIRLYAIRMLEGQNPEPLDRVATGRKDKWPSAFNLLRPFYYRVRDEQCPIADRIIRSILYMNRICTGNSTPDFTEILKPFEVSPLLLQEFKEFLKSNVSESVSLELISRPTTRVLSSGPNGKPKWQTAEVEAYALINSELNESFKSLCKSTGNLDLYEYFTQIANSQDRVDRIKLRYITTIRDSGNKCRLVAISDYWTQVILEPIMKEIQVFIRKRYGRVSSSKDHAAGFNKLKKHIRPGIHCYDVTSWTDAFPSSLQKVFMEHAFGTEIANAWYNLVVSCEWNAKGYKSTIKYSRGQGMGTAGSFDIATATDLCFLEMLYAKHYQLSISDRLLNKVGDDLWCWDPDGHIREAYEKQLGISISVPKTKYATEKNLCGEFVSRSINFGQDVSRISINICRAVRKNLLDLPELSRHLEERNFQGLIPVKEFFDVMKIKSKHSHRLIRALYLMTLVYANRPGMSLLKKSLTNDFEDFIYGDLLITIMSSKDGLEGLKQAYCRYSSALLLNSIADKTEKIMDCTFEFESSAQLQERCDPALWWQTTDPISLNTSKMIMAQSFQAHNELYRLSPDASNENVFSELERVDQSMTFKDLGVIHTDKTPWRPTATRFYNLVSKLSIRNLESSNFIPEFGYEGAEPIASISIGIPIDYTEPLFTEEAQHKFPYIAATE